MTNAERVVLALAATRECRDTVFLAQGGHARATARQDLVRVGLMAHVPHQAVVRRVEHVMQGDGQLDDAETGTKMPSGLANGVEQFQAQLIGQGFQLGFTQKAQAIRCIGSVEQRRNRALAGNLFERRGHQANRYK